MIKLFWLIIFCLQINLLASDSFLSISHSARSLAMANANIASLDKSYSFYANPALNHHKSYFASTYAKFFDDFNYNFFAYNFEFNSFYVGLAFINGYTTGIVASDYNSETQEIINTGKIFDFTNYALAFNLAKKFQDFNLGLNLKVFQQSLAQENAYGFTTDLGVYYPFNQNLKLGLVIYNFPLSFFKNYANQEDKFNSLLKTGISYQFENGILLALDLESNGYLGLGINLGLEYNFSDLVYLRGGYQKQAKIEDDNLNLGLGFRYEKLDFDFAYSMHFVQYLEPVFMGSMSYSFH